MRMPTCGVLLAALGCAALGSGCATVTGGARDPKIKVASNPPGAAVLVDGKPVGVTPAVLEVSRKSAHEVEISQPGYDTAHVTVQRCLNPWVFGNILVGGLIGVTVDVCTDATHHLSPDEITVNLRPHTEPCTIAGVQPQAGPAPHQ
jgi:hypothetical protein